MSNRDQEFLRLADDEMRRLLAQLDEFDPDELEADASEGVIKMVFGDGAVCVLNRQTAAHQIWLAEGASAWHFERNTETGGWEDTKGRGELRTVLGGILSRRLGREVALAGR
ncbi:MAG TPA: iron donor protein CyaY [bacterium]|nr:iron donor protein CyaY [bacterium]